MSEVANGRSLDRSKMQNARGMTLTLMRMRHMHTQNR